MVARITRRHAATGLAALGGAALLPAPAGADDLLDGARKEGTLTWYIAQVDGETGAQSQRMDVLRRDLAEARSLQRDATQLEELQAHPVSAAVALEPAHFAQLARQAMDSRLGQADAVTDLTERQGVVAAVERGEDRLQSAHDAAVH